MIMITADLGGSLGTLAKLPRELRDQVFGLLVISRSKHWATFGHGGGLELAILRTSRRIHKEARAILLASRHRLVDGKLGSDYWSNMPPFNIVGQLQRITYSLHYSTANRGDCELRIREVDHLLSRACRAATVFRHSAALKELRIDLLNDAQAKSGPKRLRTQEVYRSMRQVLVPFACVTKPLVLEVGGYDAIEYTEMFHELRLQFLSSDGDVAQFVRDAIEAS